MDMKRCISCWQLIARDDSRCPMCRQPQDLFSPAFHVAFLVCLTTLAGASFGLAFVALGAASAIHALAAGGLIGVCVGLAAWTVGPEHASVAAQPASGIPSACRTLRHS
jgi:hypothetical protein